MRAMEMLRARFEEASAAPAPGSRRSKRSAAPTWPTGRNFRIIFDACARLELHAPDGAEPSPQEAPCIECGKRVHDVVVEALATGQRDGTIRADLGDLQVTSRVLWGFTHGLIQIAITKGEPLAQQGISVHAADAAGHLADPPDAGWPAGLD